MPVRKSWDILSKINLHQRDSCVSFEEKAHKYRINGSIEGWKSVTEFLSKFHDKFNPNKAASMVVNSRRYKEGTHNLSEKTKDEIISFWETENKRGTSLHARMERSMNRKYHLKLRSDRHSNEELLFEKRIVNFADEKRLVMYSKKDNEVYVCDSSSDIDPFPDTFLGFLWKDNTVRRNPREDSELGDDEPVLRYPEAVIETEQVKGFWLTHSHLKPYRSEWVVWDEEWKIAGTIDAVCKDERDGSYWILDWKRVRNGLQVDLDAIKWGYIPDEDEYLDYPKSYGKMMPSPLDDIHITKYWNYSLQLNLYREILEKNYGIKIKGMMLVQFHPEIGSMVRVHKVVRLEEPMKRILSTSSPSPEQEVQVCH